VNFQMGDGACLEENLTQCLRGLKGSCWRTRFQSDSRGVDCEPVFLGGKFRRKGQANRFLDRRMQGADRNRDVMPFGLKALSVTLPDVGLNLPGCGEEGGIGDSDRDISRKGKKNAPNFDPLRLWKESQIHHFLPRADLEIGNGSTNFFPARTIASTWQITLSLLGFGFSSICFTSNSPSMTSICSMFSLRVIVP
jgi:hypothetical protein